MIVNFLWSGHEYILSIKKEAWALYGTGYIPTFALKIIKNPSRAIISQRRIKPKRALSIWPTEYTAQISISHTGNKYHFKSVKASYKLQGRTP